MFLGWLENGKRFLLAHIYYFQKSRSTLKYMPRSVYLLKTYVRRKQRYFLVSKNRFPKVAKLLYILLEQLLHFNSLKS
jgi:hypothetical protein